MKRLVIGALSLSVFLLLATQAYAVSDPPLFSCGSPIGTKIADTSGTHGVPGDMTTYTGSDQVYEIDGLHVLQCLCPSNSQGIQSNWWKIGEMSQEDIDFFVRRGWVFVPSGQPWGLSNSAYLVKNQSYSCQGNGGGSSSSNSGGSSSSSSSSSSSGTGGAVAGITTAAGKILGISTLASTGTTQTILFFFALALVFGYLAYRSAQE